MLKKLRNFKTMFLVMFAIIAIAVSTVSVRFLADTITYVGYLYQLHDIESDAEAGYWSANGYVRWTDEHTKRYNEVQEEKSEFVESNDVATYLYYSGYSFTGKVIRILAIVFAIITILLSVGVVFTTIRILFRRLVRRTKKFFKPYSYMTTKNQG